MTISEYRDQLIESKRNCKKYKNENDELRKEIDRLRSELKVLTDVNNIMVVFGNKKNSEKYTYYDFHIEFPNQIGTEYHSTIKLSESEFNMINDECGDEDNFECALANYFIEDLMNKNLMKLVIDRKYKE